jgi:hypothetical protein
MRKDPSLYIFDRQPANGYPDVSRHRVPRILQYGIHRWFSMGCLWQWQYIPVAHLRVVCSGYIDVARQAEEMIVETKYTE